MEANLLVPIPDYKLYKDRSVYIGTFLGGPIAAGYLIAENFKKLGQPAKAKNTWVIAITTTILVIAAALLLSAIQKLPPYIIPIIYALAAQALMKKYQLQAINIHIEKGGQTYSIWRAVLIGIIGGVVLFGCLFLLIITTQPSLIK